MSDLIEHAKRELKLAGMYDADADYGSGKLADAVLPLIGAFSVAGHSGMSASITIDLFTKLASFKRLSELTDDPDEWSDVSGYNSAGRPREWQNKRQGSCFSHDGGKTYYDIDEKRVIQNETYGFPMHASKHVEKQEYVADCAEASTPDVRQPDGIRAANPAGQS